MPKIKDKNTDMVYSVKEGIEILQAYRINPSLPFKFGCCNGQCGTCAIKVVEGNENLSKPTKEEKSTLEAKKLSFPPHRLACQCAIMGDITIES